MAAVPSSPLGPRVGPRAPRDRLSLIVPETVCAAVLRAVDGAARRLVSLAVPANAVTVTCIVAAAAAGLLLATGYWGIAAVLLALASLGDALDGMVARRSGSASVGGALLDAVGDRYQEAFAFAGLAVAVRASAAALLVTLLAMTGSFMVSYASAKAEAFGVPVPAGVMRRTERAICLSVGTFAVPPWRWAVHHFGLPAWTEPLPVLASLSIIAVAGNVSALRRLWLVGRLAACSDPPCSDPRGAPTPLAAGEPGARPAASSRASSTGPGPDGPRAVGWETGLRRR
jgi:CDP-diacylglycerol--glycerol-3-phosphate 3-phosphatidyltransferase